MSRYYEESEIMKALDSNLVGTYNGLVLNVNMDEFLDGVPTADVVEVVRCKDCVYYENFLCGRFSAYGDSVEEPEYDFCSYGERREDGELH